MKFEILVGNIGKVHTGFHEAEAEEIFQNYCEQSFNGYGRASGEDVIMMKDGIPFKEYNDEIPLTK